MNNFAEDLLKRSEGTKKSPFLIQIFLETLEKIVNEIIEEREDLFLVEVKVSGHSGSQKVLVLIDGDNGVGIDDCSKISRKLAAIMDEQDLIKGKYVLEVSSSGVDHPLINERQYKKNVGRKLKVNTDESEYSGELKEVSAEGIVVKSEKKVKNKVEISEVEIPFKKINKAKVLVTF